MGYVKKAAVIVAVGLVLAAAAPTLALAAVRAQEVLVRNTDAEPVPTKAIGTTSVSGAVGINGPVSVSGAVSVPDGVAINGTPTVNVAGGSLTMAPAERFVAQASATGGTGGEVCSDLAVPADTRYLVEAIHLDVNTSAEPNVYIRLTRATGPGATSFLRFTAPLVQRGPAIGSFRSLSGRIEGPFVAHPSNAGSFEILALCVQGEGTNARAVFVGEVGAL